MKNLNDSELKEINGGAQTENEEEFAKSGREWGLALRNALSVAGMFLLFKM